MKCLVTGGAGFIGSHLCEQLLLDNHEVIAIDNEVTGSFKNIAHLVKNKNFQYIKHDCTRPLSDTLKSDAIFHFASPASPPKYIKIPIETLLVNTFGTYLLLEKAKDWSAQFIFASTSEIYGDPRQHPQKESYWGNVNPNGSRSCYDEAKRAGEAFVMSFVRKYKIRAQIIRIFNTYGPRMDINDGRVITNFINQIQNDSDLTIQGDGNQTRSFCYISDLIEGIIKVFNAQLSPGTVLNLGNTKEYKIIEIADELIKLAGYPRKYTFINLPEDDPQRRKPDITQAKKLIGWEPKISLQDGLVKTLAYFKSLQ